jgi:hypothetical protein
MSLVRAVNVVNMTGIAFLAVKWGINHLPAIWAHVKDHPFRSFMAGQIILITADKIIPMICETGLSNFKNGALAMH